jgi:hypothetical protein
MQPLNLVGGGIAPSRPFNANDFSAPVRAGERPRKY